MRSKSQREKDKPVCPIFTDLVPPEVTNFYNELTEEDKQILKEIAGRHEEFQNEDQALEALKAKSEKLYNKVKKRILTKFKFFTLIGCGTAQPCERQDRCSESRSQGIRHWRMFEFI